MNADEAAQTRRYLGCFVIILLFIFAPGLFSLLLSSGRAEELGTGIVYGDNHAFAVKAPQGWVLDNKSGVSNGLHAVFCPLGSTWRDSRAVMYVNTASKDAKDEGKTNGDPGGLLAFVAGDALRFKEDNPGMSVADSPSLTTKDGKTALVRTFFGDKWNNHEAVAYIDEATIVTMIVLSCRDKENFDKSFSAFKQLVASYEFITARPNVEKLKELELTGDFDARVQAAKQAELAEEGKAYGISMGPALQAALSYCLPPSAPPFRGSFTMVADVSPSGTVSLAEVRPQNDVSRCFAERMQKATLPAPPLPNRATLYPITFEINVVP